MNSKQDAVERAIPFVIHHLGHGDMDGETCLLGECALHYPGIDVEVDELEVYKAALEASQQENELLWALVRPADKAFRYLEMDDHCPPQTSDELHAALLKINNGVSAKRLTLSTDCGR